MVVTASGSTRRKTDPVRRALLGSPGQLHMHLAIALLLFAGPACASTPPDLTALALETAEDGARFDHTHALWTGVLAKHVRGDRFDYRALKDEPAALEQYLARLQSVTLEQLQSWERDQRYAFWINAYNAYTVRRVVEGYPVRSIKDLGSLARSVWDQRFIPLAHLAPALERELLSLNDVEHQILRPIFKDARVHAAVNCASLGCPRLMDHAYTAGVLDQQLDQMTRRWLAEPAHNRFDASAKTAHLSAIFDWYGADFGATQAERLRWVARYAPAEHRSWLSAHPDATRVRFLDYDWALNDVPPPRAAPPASR
jgi:hypothetical protein